MTTNKILHHQELHGDQSISDVSGIVDETLGKSPLDRQDTLKYRVFASTWNIGGIAPTDDLDLEDWLDTRANSYDIYVLGFQEIVPLNAVNVLGPSKRCISTKWNSLIGKALNKKKTRDGAQLQHTTTNSSAMESFGQEECFICIRSKQMVGIFTSVWGSVSVRFLLHETSFCVVCCHLASGGKQGDVLLRNFDAADILARTRFHGGGGGNKKLPKKILDHDQVVLLGDLNYRISLEEPETRLLVKAKNWSTLLENDQEGPVTFSPTYKYQPNSDQYYWCFEAARGEKKRAPAWCDRILWRGKGLKQIQYGTCDYKLSDHRPVRAGFIAECRIRGDAEDSIGGFMR
uniref:Inositol polyphosphate-related phosphatase domain-containing protein n=1 Tax=Aegilops tauschii subsp. strangulata TaxID=200361 RepID=A0A453KS70_AEGTS